ncbi:uncharacterized protein LOC130665436 isoform X3 [Microplitis mediator]|uniref:uncharacterized protein LOC130665436 isoform X3 n=1 Tax=Microplitis mediator TaxID=375433 RepID=UPI00255685C8|nr:uncharacterized protein LOC130665436 isoform X3 [Microplitis mediator]
MGHRQNPPNEMNRDLNDPYNADNAINNLQFPIDADVQVIANDQGQITPNGREQRTLSSSIPSPFDLHNLTTVIDRRFLSNDAIIQQMSIQIDECIRGHHDSQRQIRHLQTNMEEVRQSLTLLSNHIKETNQTVGLYARCTTYMLKRARTRGDLGLEDLRLLEDLNPKKLPDINANPADLTAEIIREITNAAACTAQPASHLHGPPPLPSSPRPSMPNANSSYHQPLRIDCPHGTAGQSMHGTEYNSQRSFAKNVAAAEAIMSQRGLTYPSTTLKAREYLRALTDFGKEMGLTESEHLTLAKTAMYQAEGHWVRQYQHSWHCWEDFAKSYTEYFTSGKTDLDISQEIMTTYQQHREDPKTFIKEAMMKYQEMNKAPSEEEQVLVIRARLSYEIQSQLDSLAPHTKTYSQLNSAVRTAVQRLAQRAKAAAETRKPATYTKRSYEGVPSSDSEDSEIC